MKQLKQGLLHVALTATLLLAGPFKAAAETNCDSQPKPAFSCPPGYGMMCIPVGGDHWGCGRENASGGIDEAPPVQEMQIAPVAQPVATEPAPTSVQTAPSEPAKPAAQPTIAAAAPVPSSAAPEPSDQPQVDEEPSLELGEAQELLENASEIAPPFLESKLVAAAEAIGAMVFLLGLWEWLKRMREKKTGKCGRCGGDTKAEEKRPCPVCRGAGKLEKEIEVTVPCGHCKGSGTDPCHHCGGTGKMSMPNPAQSQEELEGWPPCDFCGGSGKKKIGAGRDWGKANDAMKGDFACCFCHGKKSETFKKTIELSCPACGGKG